MATSRRWVEWDDAALEMRNSLASAPREAKFEVLGTVFKYIESAKSSPENHAQLVSLREAVRGARRRIRDGLEHRGQHALIPRGWRVDGVDGTATGPFELLVGPRARLDAARARGRLQQLSLPPERWAPSATAPKPTRSRRQQTLDAWCMHRWGRPWPGR